MKKDNEAIKDWITAKKLNFDFETLGRRVDADLGLVYKVISTHAEAMRQMRDKIQQLERLINSKL